MAKKFEGPKYRAILLQEDGICIEDEEDYDTLKEAIDFAKSRGWDEVIDLKTSKIVWSK